jgi:large subunit ribosomal protein L23
VQLFDVLRRPLVTEKNTILQAQDKYCFEVSKDANKLMVKQAVEKAFKVCCGREHGDGKR